MEENTINNGNTLIARMIGYIGTECYVQDWRTYSSSSQTGFARKATVFHKDELTYVECNAPEHHKQPDVVRFDDDVFQLSDLKYNSSWDWFVPAFNKIQKIKHDAEFCDLILSYVRHDDIKNAFKCLVNYIDTVLLNKPLEVTLPSGAKVTLTKKS